VEERGEGLLMHIKDKEMALREERKRSRCGNRGNLDMESVRGVTVSVEERATWGIYE